MIAPAQSQNGHGNGDPFWLGHALVSGKGITKEQFASARSFWAKNRLRGGFATVLQELGLIRPQELAALIAEHHGLSAVVLSPGTVDASVARLLPQDQAKRKGILPFRLNGRNLDIVVSDPADYTPRHARQDFPEHEVRLSVAPREDILTRLQEAWHPDSPPATATELFETLLTEAISEHASDLHCEPRDQALDIRTRIDGRLVHKRFIPEAMREPLIQAAKIAGRMDISEKRLPQDGRGSIDVGSRRYSLRYSSLPAVNGESVVVRIIDENAGSRSFDEIGLMPKDVTHVRELLELPDGLVYVTGPTGAGKTTLLYSMLSHLPEIDELKIVTLEEPVEFRNPRFFLQVGIDERIGRTFGELLRHCLRHDPDVILVGETRDRETAEITLRASLTGHLCFSTLHAKDALSTIERLTDLGLDPVMLASALKGLIAQRLVRCPCPHCQEPHPRRESFFPRYGRLLEEEGVDQGRANFVSVVPGRSCPTCLGRGYRGRLAIAEVLPLQGLEDLVSGKAPPEKYWTILRERGCRTLFEDGVRKAALGLTTLEEVFAAVIDGASPGSPDAGPWRSPPVPP